MPLSFVYYIHGSGALIFCTLYPWLYEVLARTTNLLRQLVPKGEDLPVRMDPKFLYGGSVVAKPNAQFHGYTQSK